VGLIEAAAQLGVSRYLHKANAIRFGKLLGRTVIAQSEIDRLVASAVSGEPV
jgi:hypothetical protein